MDGRPPARRNKMSRVAGEDVLFGADFSLFERTKDANFKIFNAVRNAKPNGLYSNGTTRYERKKNL